MFRSLTAALGMLASAGLFSAALAQQGKPTTIVVPFAPGGAQDVIARFVGAKLATRIASPVIIENKAGAGGVIGADQVAKAAPDGTTLLMATGGAITIAPHLNARLPYESMKDFTPVALLGDTPMTLAVRAESPFQSVADLVKAAKEKPGEVTFASTGNGTVSNLTGELFALSSGIKLLHVPYRGAGPAITDLLSGQVASMVTSSASIEPMVASGKARVLASFTTVRLPSLKGAPTMTEVSGLRGLEVPVWVAVLAPARTSPDVVARLSAELQAICAEAETRERFEKLGALTTCGGPAEAGKVIADDLARWKSVIATGVIKAE